MTIKEMEELSGIPRANIRFYEKEGLIAPQRNANGYRNYSEEDLNTLKRIRLLRMVHISLEDIKALNRKECELTDLLLKHLKTLDSERQNLEESRRICEQLLGSRAAYDGFDAQDYFDEMNTSSLEKTAEMKEDSLPKVTAPWVRYLARMIDETIYSILWYLLLSLGFHVNIMGIAGVWALMLGAGSLLFAESAMLSLFGTTPGKFLFGLRVSAENGARLTWNEAFRRTWTVWRRGMGFYIPVYRLIRLYRSYKDCKSGKYLEWEEETVLWLEKGHMQRKAAAALALLAGLNVLILVIWQAGALPRNQGEISVQQFAENFNDMQSFYQIDRQLNLPEFSQAFGMDDSRMILNEQGKWEKLPSTSYIIGTSVNYQELPQLSFTEADGTVSGVSFSAAYENENVEISSYGDLMALTALSYICAQEDYSLLRDPPSLVYARIKRRADGFQDFEISAGGVTVKADFEYRGYELRQTQYGRGGVLVPVYGEEASFRVDYQVCGEMEKR